MGALFSYFYKADSSSVADTSVNSEKEKSDHPCITHDNTTEDPTRTEAIFQPTNTPDDHIEDAEKMNIYVMNSGRSTEIMIFPLEKIAYLLQQACEHFHKKPEHMSLVFEGEQLNGTMPVNHYPKLRRGCKVNLIRVA